MSKEFELVFEGPADESPDTLRKLRTSLLADLGLSIPEAQEVLSNVPKTIKTSELEEDLKPLYAALKKAGGKVLIVRPAEPTNDKAYFLDLEDSGIDDELLKSLEALPGEEDAPPAEPDIAVDLTAELHDFVPETEELPPTPELVTAKPVVAETPAVEAAAPVISEPAPVPPAPDLQVEAPVLAENLIVAHQPEIPPQAEIKTEKTPDLISDKPLFEFSSAAEPTPAEPAAAPAAPIVPDLKDSKPLFEFSSAAEEPVQSAPVKEEVAAEKPAAPQPSLFDDLSLSLEEPSGESHSAPAQSKTEEPAKVDLPLEEPAGFSTDDLSLSLNSQLESEKAEAEKPREAAKASTLNLSVEGTAPEKAAPPPQVSKPKEPVKQSAPAKVSAPANPNIVIEPAHPETVAAAPEEEAASVTPPPVAFKSVKKEAPSMDLILPILVGSILLGIANWLYFKPDEDVRLPKISFDSKEKERSDDSLRAEVVPSTEKTVSGKVQQGALSLSWSVVFDKEEIKTVSIEATTPQPPELTPEQIVRNERPQPWLYKVELSPFPFEKQLGGTWLAKGPARIFVSQGTNKRRLVGMAEVNVSSFKAGESVNGTILITRGVLAPQANEPFHFEQLINGDVLLYIAAAMK
ncbi:MAG: hypothetical protein J0M12_00855 [Deltaproteobacteria bacterium]|nr:hypothetical protein [Deltaproteobacteria bacterium]